MNARAARRLSAICVPRRGEKLAQPAQPGATAPVIEKERSRGQDRAAGIV